VNIRPKKGRSGADENNIAENDWKKRLNFKKNYIIGGMYNEKF
jgi:hypothetical protein